jgi:hypothetical protein
VVVYFFFFFTARSSFCAILALTIFFTSAAGSGFSTVKRMVPLETLYPFSSRLKLAKTAPLAGKKLQCSLKAPK